jgi:hypothetical protein
MHGDADSRSVDAVDDLGHAFVQAWRVGLGLR